MVFTKINWGGRYYPAIHFLNQDYVIFYSWQSHLAWSAKLLSVKNRFGFCRDKYIKYNLFHKYLVSQGVKNITPRTVFLAQQLSNVLNVDLNNNNICEVSMPTIEEINQCRELIIKNSYDGHVNKYAVIAPFGNTARNLPNNIVFAAIEYFIHKLNYHCIIINNKDCEIANNLKSMFPEKVINLCGKTSLMHIVALLKFAQLSLTTDSAPMHISCAVQTPCIAIFSNDSSNKWAPKNFCYPIDMNVPCSPCRPEYASKCTNQICINTIQPALVIKKIQQVQKLFQL
ncbi:glycosyltransferase family 9 protein [uncultured Phascolarctobacterium sp.]|uniref:glycosyltransferase family 9 protein n=1 Tax=uncultured Phascolarctobacterium sp. TaxID=512296 RepID=UPI00262DDAAC|nr:glycosyltransferase family 9 protein [uncultured Phascolarctobacterium sp.]